MDISTLEPEGAADHKLLDGLHGSVGMSGAVWENTGYSGEYRYPITPFSLDRNQWFFEQDQQCTYNTNWMHSCNHFSSGKSRNITYLECVFLALII